MDYKKAAADRAKLLAQALVEASAMDETRDYLLRGRAYSALELHELKARWTQAFKNWFRTRSRENQTSMDDLSAELRLRKEPEPHDTVQEELAAMREEIVREDPDGRSPGVQNAIAEFMTSLDKPSN